MTEDLKAILAALSEVIRKWDNNEIASEKDFIDTIKDLNQKLNAELTKIEV